MANHVKMWGAKPEVYSTFVPGWFSCHSPGKGMVNIMSRKIMALLLCFALVFSTSVWMSTAEVNAAEQLTITFDQGASTPGGESHWNINNPNTFEVPYQFQIVGSNGTSPVITGEGTAAVGSSVLVTDTLDTDVPRIDELRLEWDPTLTDTVTGASITADSTEYFRLTAAAVHGDIQLDGETDSLLGTTNHWIGTTLDLRAVPDTQYLFDIWGGDMGAANDTNPDGMVMDTDKTISASFILKTYDVTVRTALTGTGMGAVSGGGTFVALSTPVISASPDSGSWFQGWYLNGVLVSEHATYTLPAVTENVTYVANFMADGTAQPEPRLTLDKKVNGSDGTVTLNVNGTATYTILVTNTGNLTVSEITLVDTMSPDSPYDTFALAPLTSRTFTYTSTFATVGTFVNTTTVTGSAMVVPFDSAESDAVRVAVGPYSDTVTVSVSVPTPTSPSTSTSTSTPSTYVVPDYLFILVNEGPGHALPNTGSFAKDIDIQMLILPDAGAYFVGWFGENGADMVNDHMVMTENKTVIARFAMIGTVPDTSVPGTPPVVIPMPVVTPTPLPVVTPVVVVPVEDLPLDEVPEAAPTLPQTAGVPIELYGLLASGLIGGGILLRKKTARK